MAGVEERVELVVAGLLAAHPRFRAGQVRVAFGVVEVARVARRPKQLGSAPLHVVGPSGFGVAIGRAVGVALLDAFAGATEAVDFFARRQAASREHGLVRVVLPDLEGQGHRGGVASGEVGQARRFARVASESLRPAVGGIHHAGTALAPAVVSGVVGRQSPAAMVAIVRHLMIQHLGRRMQLQHPVETPAGLVEKIGQAVAAGAAEGVEPIAENRRSRLLRRRIVQFPGEQHLRGGVARREQVLQEVGGVVPTAASVDGRSGRKRPVGGPAVELVTVGVQPRIEAATLLPHELQQQIRQRLKDRVVYDDRLADGAAKAKAVSPGPAQRREVQFHHMVESAPAHSRRRTRDALEHRSARVQIDDVESCRERLVSKGNGEFRALHRVANLAGANVTRQQAVDALERVTSLFEPVEQFRQARVHLVHAFGAGSQVHQQHRAIEPVRVLPLALEDAVEDRL